MAEEWRYRPTAWTLVLPYLVTYQDAHGLSIEELAQALGCSIPELAGLAFCVRPDRAQETIAERVADIAGTIPVNQERLQEIFDTTWKEGAFFTFAQTFVTQYLHIVFTLNEFPFLSTCFSPARGVDYAIQV